MDPMKQQILRKLIANVIVEKCARNENLIFQESLCTQERVIRFATPFWKEKFPKDFVMYEAENGTDSFVVNCVWKGKEKNPLAAKLFAVLGVTAGEILQSWDITSSDPNAIFNSFDVLISKTIPVFEKDLEAKLQKDFVEGEKVAVFTAKYERNPQARAACLAYHGYTCKVCGMNFEKTYGEEFKGIIEVHHIVPLNRIGESYVVDPIHDLIPVCPNCHAAIHSKNGSSLIKK